MTYEYMPKANNKGLKAICTGLFFGSAVLFLASGLKDVIKMPWLMQFIAICMLTVSIMLMGRYMLRYYAYRVAEVDRGVDFTVDEVTSRGRVTVCRLGLYDLIAIKEWNGENKPPRGKKIYNYCVEVRPTASWVAEFADGEERIYIRFSPDQKMLSVFENALAKREEDGE